MGYQGAGPIGLQREGVIKPILQNPNYQRDTTGLGYKGEGPKEPKGKAKITPFHETSKAPALQFRKNGMYVDPEKQQIAQGIIDRLGDNDDSDSNDYEWDSLSDCTEEIGVDVVHHYSNDYHEGESSRSDSLGLVPRNTTLVDREGSERYLAIDESDESMEIDLTDTIINLDNFSINTISAFETDPNDPMPLVHPELINWDSPDHPELDVFHNDDTIIDYLGIRDHLPPGDHKSGFLIELNDMAYFGESANPFSHKNIKIINRSNGENHSVAVLDPKIVKRNDASDGENLSEAPDDGRIDTLPNYLYREQSAILIESIVPLNIGTEESPRILKVAASLTEPDKEAFAKFFKERQINFAWSYADMPSLDPNLIMHHLSIRSGVKPVK